MEVAGTQTDKPRPDGEAFQLWEAREAHLPHLARHELQRVVEEGQVSEGRIGEGVNERLPGRGSGLGVVFKRASEMIPEMYPMRRRGKQSDLLVFHLEREVGGLVYERPEERLCGDDGEDGVKGTLVRFAHNMIHVNLAASRHFDQGYEGRNLGVVASNVQLSQCRESDWHCATGHGAEGKSIAQL